ncbi:unnamed protein product, partial [Amoebophrya sp. A25]
QNGPFEDEGEICDALSVPDSDVASRVVKLLTTQFWGDDAGFSYLPQGYHAESGCRNGLDTDNVRTWDRVLVLDENHRDETTAAECLIRLTKSETE